MKSKNGEGGLAATKAFTITKRVRLADTDATGALYFGAYGRIVEIAEVEFFRSIGFAPAVLADRGVIFTRVHAEFDFFKPVLVDDLLELHIVVAGVGVHSVRFAFDITRDGMLVAEATLVSACVDGTRRSIALPDDIAALLRAHQIDA